MYLAEALRFSVDALRSNRIRSLLTALGLVIGNASVILVVTISLTSREYILEQISGVGSNLIMAYFETGSREATTVAADFVNIADVEAVRAQLGPRIVAATGVMSAYDSLVIDGRPRDVLVLGSDDQYAYVRNLVQLAGRPLDPSDVLLRQRVALLTEELAQRLYGSQQAAVGQVLKIRGLQFTVIGTFKEKTATYGLSELARESILIPITVLRYFVPYERIDPLYVQARRAEDVPALTEEVRRILESRHRPGAKYYVGNLTGILEAARKIALVLTIVLILISTIALVISGIGIMNIMLVTVTERTREIGIRMAVGASRRDILQQFLVEAMLLSVSGGLAGVLLGVAIPLSAQFFLSALPLTVSWVSIVVAFGVSFLVGVVFGLLPANRAARLNPTEALRYE
ncbi:MAG: ABC transporter permease [Bryobacterales bacterium]|nr:ABC transporter permease [Bryobacteraceae bacterium]MDW8355823.1 ABC transporter permease [Bryobacterales bacterium]